MKKSTQVFTILRLAAILVVVALAAFQALPNSVKAAGLSRLRSVVQTPVGQELELTGPVTTLDGSVLLVNGQRLVIDSASEVKGQIVLGALVKAHVTSRPDGSFSVREIQVLSTQASPEASQTPEVTSTPSPEDPPNPSKTVEPSRTPDTDDDIHDTPEVEDHHSQDHHSSEDSDHHSDDDSVDHHQADDHSGHDSQHESNHHGGHD